MMSPAMISRMALVSATPGTSTISTPIVTVSTSYPKPRRTSSRESSEPTVLHTTVRKKLLLPMNRPPYKRQIPTAKPHTKAHRPSRK